MPRLVLKTLLNSWIFFDYPARIGLVVFSPAIYAT